MNNIPFEITREEILSLAAQKLVDTYGCDEHDIGERAEEMIKSKVNDLFAETRIKQRIDEALSKEIDRLLGSEICPVDIWGQREGTPTTLRAALAERAQKFWELRVDAEGRESSYGGTPRSEQLMKKLLQEEFEKAVRNNAEVIVAEFKKALLVDATKLVTANIERLINVPKRRA